MAQACIDKNKKYVLQYSNILAPGHYQNFTAVSCILLHICDRCEGHGPSYYTNCKTFNICNQEFIMSSCNRSLQVC